MTMHCTIAIPTYNRARQVHRAVSAALSQSYDNLSVVVIDDGSADGTAAALAPFFDHPQFIYIQLQRNAGTGKAKNVALALANFDAITFMIPTTCRTATRFCSSNGRWPCPA